MMVEATSTSLLRWAKSHIAFSISGPFIWPCTMDTRAPPDSSRTCASVSAMLRTRLWT